LYYEEATSVVTVSGTFIVNL